MADIIETLVVSEVLSRIKEIKETAGDINIIAAAKVISGGVFFEDDSAVLRDRMVGMASILIAAISEIDRRSENADG